MGKIVEQEPIILNWQTLGHLHNGRAGALIDLKLKAALEDCADKPALDKPRTVTITLEMKPTMDEYQNLEAVQVSVSAKASVPTVKTVPTMLKANIESDDAGEYISAQFPTVFQNSMFQKGSD